MTDIQKLVYCTEVTKKKEILIPGLWAFIDPIKAPQKILKAFINSCALDSAMTLAYTKAAHVKH